MMWSLTNVHSLLEGLAVHTTKIVKARMCGVRSQAPGSADCGLGSDLHKDIAIDSSIIDKIYTH